MPQSFVTLKKEMMIEPVNSDIPSSSSSPSSSSLILKSRNKKNGSASSHSSSGRGHREELIHCRHTSSSSDQSDIEDHTPNSNNKLPKRKNLQKRQPAFSTEEDDDERTDSADEGIDEEPKVSPVLKPSLSSSTSSYYNHHSYTMSSVYNNTTGSGVSGSGLLKPLSPTSLHVGYGSDLVMATNPNTTGTSTIAQGGVMEEEREGSDGCLMNEGSDRGKTIIEGEGGSIGGSPSRFSERVSSSGLPSPTAERINTDVQQTLSSEQDERPLNLPSSSLPPKPVTIATGGANPVLPSPSLPPPTTNTALPFAGWGWGQPTAALYSPFCAPTGGSMATTPAIGDALTPFLPPGATTYLQAVICQELEGVLVVNIHWRNKTYSGSLIDLQHHEWAPPRLVEDVPDLSIKLQDIFKKQQQELEKETAIDVIDVTEDKEGGTEKVVAMETSEQPKVTNSNNKITKNGTDTHLYESTNTGVPKSDHTSSLRLPNGLQVPSIVAPPTSDDKLSKATPFLPPFDAVKSPQPQLAAGDNKERGGVKSKATTPPPHRSNSTNSVIVAGGGVENKMADHHHHNFNTLVDVAASMKPVHDEKSSDDTLSDKDSSTSCLKSTVTYRPIDGHTHHHGNGDDSDSSGSGSLSPIKKKTPHRKKRIIIEEPYSSMETKDNKLSVKTQPDTPSFSSVPFAFSTLLPPISPTGESNNSNTTTTNHQPVPLSSSSSPAVPPATVVGGGDRELIQPPKVIKTTQYWSPSGSNRSTTTCIGKDLDSRYPPNIEPTNVPPTHLVPSLVAFPDSGVYPSGAGHMIPTATPPQGGVIQDKSGKIISRKRKTGQVDDTNKRMPSSPKDHEGGVVSRNKPLPPLPSSFTHLGGPGVGTPHHMDPAIIIQQQPITTNISAGDIGKLPEGFIYEPSMPMSKEYQLLAYQKEKEKEMEKLRGVSGGVASLGKKKSRDDHRHTSPSPPGSAFRRNPPPMSVVVSDHMIPRHMGGVMTHPQIKQEVPPPSGRPPSKGHHHTSSSSSNSKNSLHSTGGSSDKKRSSSSRSKPDPVTIKKEPEQMQWSPAHFSHLGLHVPPGMAAPTVLNLPPGLAMPISSSPPSQLPHNFAAGGVAQYGIHLLPTAAGATLAPPTKSKPDSAHSGRHRQTPSPNPKKVHEWPHPHGHTHIITPTPTKPESSGRHGNQSAQVPTVDSSKSHHIRIPSLPPPLPPSNSSTSSSSRHKGTPSDGGSRHSHSSHSHPSPSPTHQGGIRNGTLVPMNDDVMKMQMLQLELQKQFQTPQDFMAWQARVMGGGAGTTAAVPIDQATLQMQLAAVQQQQMAAMVQQQQAQQQQHNEAALANFQALAAAQSVPTVIPFMQPFPIAATPSGIPFALHPPPPPKRDS